MKTPKKAPVNGQEHPALQQAVSDGSHKLGKSQARTPKYQNEKLDQFQAILTKNYSFNRILPSSKPAAQTQQSISIQNKRKMIE